MNISLKKFVDLNENELQKIDTFINEEIDGTVFLTTRWLKEVLPHSSGFLNETFIIFDNAKIVCVFPLFISRVKKFFMKIAYQSPNFNSYPIVKKSLKESEIIKLQEIIINYINGFDNLIIRANQSPLQNIKFPDYTINDFFAHSTLLAHQVISIANEEGILKNSEGRFRTDIKKAIKVGYECQNLVSFDQKEQIIERILECYVVAFKSKYKKETNRIDSFRKLFNNLIVSEYTNIYLLLKDSKIIGYAFLFEFKDMAYFSNSFTIRDSKYPSANSYFLYQILLHLSNKNIKFFELASSYHDSDNALQKQIYKFKRSLGARIVYGKKSVYFTNKYIRKIMGKIFGNK